MKWISRIPERTTMDENTLKQNTKMYETGPMVKVPTPINWGLGLRNVVTKLVRFPLIAVRKSLKFIQ